MFCENTFWWNFIFRLFRSWELQRSFYSLNMLCEKDGFHWHLEYFKQVQQCGLFFCWCIFPRVGKETSSSFRALWGLTYYFILFQLVTQCNAKYVECFSAQKDCNKEKNRNSSVVPCKITSSVWLLPSITFCTEFSRCDAWKGIATRKEKCNLLFRPSCLVFQNYPDETEQKKIVTVSATYTVQVKC